MTTLSFALSNALVKKWKPDDEVVITQLDHEGNRGPWLNLKDRGIVIRQVKVNKNGVLDYEDMKKKINSKNKTCMHWRSF